MRTIRLQKEDNTWKEMACEVREADGEGATIYVPEWKGTWLIHRSGAMIANIGGNDWRIYTLHPDDCADLCKAPEKKCGETICCDDPDCGERKAK